MVIAAPVWWIRVGIAVQDAGDPVGVFPSGRSMRGAAQNRGYAARGGRQRQRSPHPDMRKSPLFRSIYAISWVQMVDKCVDVIRVGVTVTYSTIFSGRRSGIDRTLDYSPAVLFVPPSLAQLAAPPVVRHGAAAVPRQAGLPLPFDAHSSLVRSYRSNTEVASP